MNQTVIQLDLQVDELPNQWHIYPVVIKMYCSQSPAPSIKVHANYGGKDSGQGLEQKDFKVFGNLPQSDSLVGSNPTGPRRKNKRKNSTGGYRHFKAVWVNWLSSFRPLWHGVLLTPNVKPKSYCFSDHCFPPLWRTHESHYCFTVWEHHLSEDVNLCYWACLLL